MVKPIFNLAGVDASVVVSQRSNQIREFIMTQSLETFDGIVCIGGDGTFSEVFNGLIFRTINQLDLNTQRLEKERLPTPNMPIGVVPAGSTDTVAYCLNGTTDIRSTVLHIVLGQIKGLDLASVSNGNGLLKFYASVMSYGFLGDVAIDSEKFRWMGPKRYDYSGTWHFILFSFIAPIEKMGVFFMYRFQKVAHKSWLRWRTNHSHGIERYAEQRSRVS